MRMLQYLLWTNCNNNCRFCIRGDKSDSFKNLSDMLESVKKAKESICNQDWTKYDGGISVIGGELFYIKDEVLQDALFSLFETVVDKVLKLRENIYLVLISNLIYDTAFLEKVLNMFKNRGVEEQIQLHTSYDIKYRYATIDDKLLYEQNLYKIRKLYPNLAITVQNILTQYFIEQVNSGKFDINSFEDEFMVKFALLVPLKSNLSSKLSDFFPKRKDFINFLIKISSENPIVFRKFIDSARYAFTSKDFIDTQNDKELIPSNSAKFYAPNMKCGHSDVFNCYSDSDKCMLCDIEALCQRGGGKIE